MATQQQAKQIGETIGFTTDYSASGVRHLFGEVTGRDWSFDTLLFYTVKTLAGTRYHVNADTFEAGRPL